MTRSKRAFAELFASAQGRGEDEAYIAELCEKYSVVDLIYELKKHEETPQKMTPEPEPTTTPAPPQLPEAEEVDPVKDFLVDIWSRLST